MKPADYHVPDRQIQLLGPDAFISSGTEVFTIEAGAARPTLSARFTDVFQRQTDGSWKIVHEHVSMPPASQGQLALGLVAPVAEQVRLDRAAAG